MRTINRLVFTSANNGNTILLELLDENQNETYVEVGFDTENEFSPIKGNANMSKATFDTYEGIISDPTSSDFAMVKSNIKLTAINLIELL